jgi:hypothetical protein
MQDFSAFYGETIRTTGTIFLPLGDERSATSIYAIWLRQPWPR